MHRLKKEIFSKLQEWAILLIFYYLFIHLFFWQFIDFFTISLRSYFWGDPNGGNFAYLDFASILFNYFIT